MSKHKRAFSPFLTGFFLSLMVAFVLSLASMALAVPKSLEELSAISNKLIKTTVQHGGIGSFFRPAFGRMMDADLSLDKHEPVFVVAFPEGVRIYPQRIMVWHQVSNELMGKNAYAVTYCPITGTLAAYSTDFNGVDLFFDAQGDLYDGNTVLIDRNTGSLWLQALGMAFEGPMTGRGLAKIPVFWTTWDAAKRFYKDVPVLSTPRNRKAYGRDPYGNYLKTNTYYDNDTLAFPVTYSDLRLPYKNQVIGLEFNDFRLAVDVAYVKKEGAVNFFLGDTPLLAVHDKKLDVVRIFNRQVWDKPSLFIMQYGKLIDIASKSAWDASTGVSLEGNMKGASMQQYYGIYSMWFNWYNLNPETILIPGPGEVPKSVLHVDKLAE